MIMWALYVLLPKNRQIMKTEVPLMIQAEKHEILKNR